MKSEVFYYKTDMHVRPMRFSISCTPTDSSDKNPIDVLAWLVLLLKHLYEQDWKSVFIKLYFCIDSMMSLISH